MTKPIKILIRHINGKLFIHAPCEIDPICVNGSERDPDDISAIVFEDKYHLSKDFEVFHDENSEEYTYFEIRLLENMMASHEMSINKISGKINKIVIQKDELVEELKVYKQRYKEIADEQ